MIWNEALEQYVSDHQDEVVELIRTLVAIPAFSNHEQARAEFCAKWFRDVGAEDVKIDEASLRQQWRMTLTQQMQLQLFSSL